MEFPVSAGGPQRSIFSLTLFLRYNDDLPHDFICISRLELDAVVKLSI